MLRSTFRLFAQTYLSALLNEFGVVYLNEPVPRDPALRVYKFPSRNNSTAELFRAFTAGNPSILVNPEIIAEAELVDLLFEPDRCKSRAHLGLLGSLVFAPSIIDCLRWTPTADDVQNSLSQWLRWNSENTGGIVAIEAPPVDETEAEAEFEAAAERVVDRLLLVIVPSITEDLLDGFGIRPSTHLPGLYQFPPAYCTQIIVTSELPEHLSTLWLRLLGRGRTQRTAIQELIDLDPEQPLRTTALQSFQQWYRLLSQGQMGKESKLLMQLLSQIQL